MLDGMQDRKQRAFQMKVILNDRADIGGRWLRKIPWHCSPHV